MEKGPWNNWGQDHKCYQDSLFLLAFWLHFLLLQTDPFCVMENIAASSIILCLETLF